jgi:anaerobic carbon-monoxide dehydrogenase iron sulfur subunit
MARLLVVDPERCNGCRKCELVCSVKHQGVGNPALSRIRVIEWEKEGFHLPMHCQQCQDPPCMSVCPREAIYRDEELDRVLVNHDLCIGCKMCVTACPFGVMQFNEQRGRTFKCDLCGGDPQCVRFCEPKAIEYVEAGEFALNRMREAAKRFASVMPKKAA